MSIYAYLSKLTRTDFGCGLPVKTEYNFRDRILGYLTLVPPIFLFVTPLNAASSAVLSINGYPSWQKCLAGIFTAALAAWGVNTFNRYVDRERDKTAWPWRAIPTGRVKANNALIWCIILYIGSLISCWFFFNPESSLILLAAIILGSLYSSYFRDKIGYLSLPPIVGLIHLAGWAAFSPETLFTLLPWYLFILAAVWQAAHIMTHYVLHIKFDAGGKPIINTPAFFFKPSPGAATGIGVGLTVLTVLLAVVLPLISSLSMVYVIMVLVAGIYTLSRGLAILKNPLDRERRHKAWGSLSFFRLVTSAAILIDIFIYNL